MGLAVADFIKSASQRKASGERVARDYPHFLHNF